jgi:hypothetical protein
MSSVASVALNSMVACLAVLRFEPAATMPPSTAATASPKTDGSDPIRPSSVARRTTRRRDGDRPGQDEFAAAFYAPREFVGLASGPDNFVTGTVDHAHHHDDRLNAHAEPLNAPRAHRCYRLYRAPGTRLFTMRRRTFDEGGMSPLCHERPRPLDLSNVCFWILTGH